MYASVIFKEHEVVEKIKEGILSHGNPVDIEGDFLFNFHYTCICSPNIVRQILNADKWGQDLYETYVVKRTNGDVRLWAPVKKVMFQSGNTKKSVKIVITQ